ncbi:unnamed protein product [Adineta ricciae]|uniref:Uncharacterized protein n=1 Tax=Adineta ricciae TaxID=249248 RepID=A0A815V5H2_ADIRI|nr:unnamed protein product [Adineta ricciae]CAF1646637.1 unnamed protein product [Adineta ricciae]
MTITTLIILRIIHVPDLIYWTAVADKCIANFERSLLLIYSRFNTLPHYLETFAITILIIRVARSQSKGTGNVPNHVDYKEEVLSRTDYWVQCLIYNGLYAQITVNNLI